MRLLIMPTNQSKAVLQCISLVKLLFFQMRKRIWTENNEYPNVNSSHNIFLVEREKENKKNILPLQMISLLEGQFEISSKSILPNCSRRNPLLSYNISWFGKIPKIVACCQKYPSLPSLLRTKMADKWHILVCFCWICLP